MVTRIVAEEQGFVIIVFVVDASICYVFFVDFAFIVVFAEVEQGCVR